MKKLLGVVKGINDPEYQKRIQASIIGITDSIPVTQLPYAFPLDDQCIVPELNQKVWIYVNQSQDSEDYDYNCLYYEKFQEKTFEECYTVTSSESYLKRLSKKRLSEPADIASVTYPTNRVIKLSKITIEFDETNKRLCITDETGNSFRFLPTGKIERIIANSYTGIDGSNTIDAQLGTTLSSGGTATTPPTIPVEPMTLGRTLDTFLTTFRSFIEVFILWANSHVHVETGASTLVPTVPFANPVPIKPNILSTLNKNN